MDRRRVAWGLIALAGVLAGCRDAPPPASAPPTTTATTAADDATTRTAAAATAPAPSVPPGGPASGCGAYRARAGVLPAPGAVTVAGVALPPGRAAAPAVWVTDGPVPGTAAVWAALVARYPSTGLWPVLVVEPGAWATGAEPRGPGRGGGDVPVAAALGEAWARALPGAVDWDAAVRELVWPFRRPPTGLAPAVGRCAGPLVERVALGRDVPLALVAVDRPAGVLALTTWEFDVGGTTAILRSWEDRFGAYLVAVGPGTVDLGVERPPPTPDDAYRLASELFAVDPELVAGGPGSIGALAAELPGRPLWSLTSGVGPG